MTLVTESVRPQAGLTVADGLHALRVTVIGFFILEVVTGMIVRAYDVADPGDTVLVSAVQAALIAIALAATMWHRPRTATVATALVIALVLTVGPTGGEMYLVVVTAVMAGARATRWQLGLVVVGQVGYALCFKVVADQRLPGEGRGAGLAVLGVAATALAAGLVARELLRARDRRCVLVTELKRDRAHIRAFERARLAEDLRAVVTQGLATIEGEVAAATRQSSDAVILRQGLEQVGHHCRSLLDQLRILLDVLRREPDPKPDARSVQLRANVSSWIQFLRDNLVRIAGSLVLGLIAARALSASGWTAGGDRWVQMFGLLACALALWRPAAAAGLAAVGLVVSLLVETTGYWAVLPAALLCLLGARRFGTRTLLLVVPVVAAYGGLLAVTHSPDAVAHVILIGYTGLIAIVVGMAGRHFTQSRDVSLRQVFELTNARDRIESEERSSVARELHDVVAHQLSMVTMHVMAMSPDDDGGALDDTLQVIGRHTRAARNELQTLLGAMALPSVDHLRPTPLITPLTSASALAQELRENGYHPVLDIDPAADATDPTTQRTVARIMQEASTNILRYTPEGSACHYTLTTNDTGVKLTVASPLAKHKHASDLSLGWGLRGIRERVDLSHGTFSAGPDRGHWILAVTLPASVIPAT